MSLQFWLTFVIVIGSWCYIQSVSCRNKNDDPKLYEPLGRLEFTTDTPIVPREKACIDTRQYPTRILAMGVTGHRYVLLTTDLWLFERNASLVQQEHVLPPFKLLLDGPPVALRDAYPQAFQWLREHQHQVVSAFVPPALVDGPQHNDTQLQEMIMFGYLKHSSLGCIAALDLTTRGIVQLDLCSEWLAVGRPLSISMGTPDWYLQFKWSGSQVPCFGLGSLLMEESSSENYDPITFEDYDQITFDKLEDNFYFTYRDCKSITVLNVDCDRNREDLLRYFPYRDQLYMLMANGTVEHYPMQEYLKQASQSFESFIGCDEPMPRLYQLTLSFIVLIAIVAVLLQLAICFVIFMMVQALSSVNANIGDLERSSPGSPMAKGQSRRSKSHSKSQSIKDSSQMSRNARNSKNPERKSKSNSPLVSFSSGTSRQGSRHRPSVLLDVSKTRSKSFKSTITTGQTTSGAGNKDKRHSGAGIAC